MSVNEVLMAQGSWSLQLNANVPQAVLDAIRYYGHVTVTDQRVPASLVGDALLQNCRYTGVVRRRQFSVDKRVLGGPGMAMWLGDQDGKGDVYETVKTLTGSSFTAGITTLLPASGAVTAGVE